MRQGGAAPARSVPAAPPCTPLVVGRVVDVVAGVVLRALDLLGLVAADVAIRLGRGFHAVNAGLLPFQPEAFEPGQVACPAGAVDAIGLRILARIDAPLAIVTGVVGMGAGGSRCGSESKGEEGYAFHGGNPF